MSHFGSRRRKREKSGGAPDPVSRGNMRGIISKPAEIKFRE
jgi:hypothetical protein